MSHNTLVEIDNEIGFCTTKDESDGSKSLDVNIRSSEVTNQSSETKIKYINNFSSQNLSCTDSDWTEFYSIDIGDGDKWFKEIMMLLKNDHEIKIEIDGETIIELNIQDFQQTLVE